MKIKQKKRGLYSMDEFIKQLDPNLDYISHEIKDGKCYITVTSNRKEVTCPFCGWPSSRIHSTYNRTFQYKVIRYLLLYVTENFFVIILIVTILPLQKGLILSPIKRRKPAVLRMKLCDYQ